MRRVRLTEGQLHNVIRESVNNILNEIDWKTYDNAADKKIRRLQNPSDSDEINRYVKPLVYASQEALHRKYPHAYATYLDSWNSKDPIDTTKMSPEEYKEYMEFNKDYCNYEDNKYKYEKGGRGYYLDDED